MTSELLECFSMYMETPVVGEKNDGRVELIEAVPAEFFPPEYWFSSRRIPAVTALTLACPAVNPLPFQARDLRRFPLQPRIKFITATSNTRSAATSAKPDKAKQISRHCPAIFGRFVQDKYRRHQVVVRSRQ
ncbi:hypothetical protein OUZ56_029649 [Daphnia magna]|uniref:Uncharacterized protein n=1 Tax=Daphnia magna TaxID=35525 RepID=A0ABR0B7F6_9CRUS|nr:hypothetical protein OUZ56_029649 [Daphnia magna]